MTAASNNSMQLEGKTILLGITGGIAAYKSCNIVRLLQKSGARVKVVMSEHATEFVGPLTFRTLTNEPVAVGLFDDPSDPIHHISLAQEADLVVVAPATANIIAKMANGIADDLISIAAIAIFYGQSPNPFWLGAAALVTCALVWLNRTQHYRLAPYSVLGLLLWFCMFKSGVHATLAGVILAFTIPAKCGVKLDSLTDWLGECLPLLDDRYDDEAHILGQHDFTVSTTKVERVMHRVTPPLIRMERLISTPVNFVILPIFAFVNAQVRLVGVDMSTLLTDPVTLGVYFGMLLGKPIGIFGMTFALVKLKISELPRNVNWHMIAGVGILGGIGFTMSILISGLAFPTAQFEVLAAKAAILAGSVTAAVLGMIYMSVVCKHPAPKDE